MKISQKNWYRIFIVTVVLFIVANELILQYNLKRQESDAKIINIAGRQRMLSQKIAKQIYRSSSKHESQETALAKDIQVWQNAHEYLKSVDLGADDGRIDSLVNLIEPDIKTIHMLAELSPLDSESLNQLATKEIHFLKNMDALVKVYQEVAEAKLKRTKTIAALLSILSVLILLIEFFIIIQPLFKNLIQKNHRLEIANRRLSDFAHITSHNLRAPLNNLGSLLYMNEHSEDEDEKKVIMEKIMLVNGHMNETLNVLVDSLKAQHVNPNEIEPVHFEPILRSTLTTLSSQISAAKADISYDFSNLPAIDHKKIYVESIFLNLVSNAIKYRSEDREPELFVTSYEKAGKKSLHFKDNGRGIDLARHGEKVFGLNKTFHRHPEAKGVGLFMTRTQIESMGGTITVESEVNKGTEFTITF